jgi:hypothetical protein
VPKEYSAEPCPRCIKERAEGTLGENYRCEACRILFFEWKLSEKDKTIKHLDIELKKKERKIKTFCRNDCDGGKEMGLCECCSLGTLLDSPKPPDDKPFAPYGGRPITHPKPSDPIDLNFPKCAGCRRASHNAHCGLAVTGQCIDGSMFELCIICPSCNSGKLIDKRDDDGNLVGQFCENCDYTRGDA